MFLGRKTKIKQWYFSVREAVAEQYAKYIRKKKLNDASVLKDVNWELLKKIQLSAEEIAVFLYFGGIEGMVGLAYSDIIGQSWLRWLNWFKIKDWGPQEEDHKKFFFKLLTYMDVDTHLYMDEFEEKTKPQVEMEVAFVANMRKRANLFMDVVASIFGLFNERVTIIGYSILAKRFKQKAEECTGAELQAAYRELARVLERILQQEAQHYNFYGSLLKIFLTLKEIPLMLRLIFRITVYLIPILVYKPVGGGFAPDLGATIMADILKGHQAFAESQLKSIDKFAGKWVGRLVYWKTCWFAGLKFKAKV